MPALRFRYWPGRGRHWHWRAGGRWDRCWHDVPIAAALARFEQGLRPLVLEKQQAGRRMANWFVPATPLHALVRDTTVNILTWPPLSGLIGRFFSFSSKGFSLALH